MVRCLRAEVIDAKLRGGSVPCGALVWRDEVTQHSQEVHGDDRHAWEEVAPSTSVNQPRHRCECGAPKLPEHESCRMCDRIDGKGGAMTGVRRGNG